MAYLVLPPDLLERYLQTFPSGHPGVSAFDAEALAQLMASGQWEQQLRRMVAENRKCYDELGQQVGLIHAKLAKAWL